MLFAITVSKFPVSFCIVRSLTMSYLEKKQCRGKQGSSHLYSAVMFFSLIQFEASPTGSVYCFFHVATAFKRQWKHSLKFVAQKIDRAVPDDEVTTGQNTIFWTWVIWWLMLNLSALYFIYLWFYWTTVYGNAKTAETLDASGVLVWCKDRPTPRPRLFFYAL